MKARAILIYMVFSISGMAQPSMTSEEAVTFALKNNGSVKAAQYKVEEYNQLKRTGFDLPKTDVSVLYGQYNGYGNDNNISVSQSLPILAFGAQGALNRARLTSSQLKQDVLKNELAYQVRRVCYQLYFEQAKMKMLNKEDSIFNEFLHSADARYKSGETNLLEYTTAKVQYEEVKNKIRKEESDINALRAALKSLLNASFLPELQYQELNELTVDLSNVSFQSSPVLAFTRQQIAVAEGERKAAVAKAAPDLSVGFFNQTLIGVVNTETGIEAGRGDRFTGFQLGVAIPLWVPAHQSRAKAARYARLSVEQQFDQEQQTLESSFQQAILSHDKAVSSLLYYRTIALPNAALLLQQSDVSFRNGEIGYPEFLMAIKSSIAIREGFLQALNECNQSVLLIEFLSGNK